MYMYTRIGTCLAERGGVDAGDDDVVAVLLPLEPLAHVEGHLRVMFVYCRLG